MPDIKDTLYTLQNIFKNIDGNKQQLEEYSRLPANADLAGLCRDLEQHTQRLLSRAQSALARLDTYPPRFAGLEQKLEAFHKHTRKLAGLGEEAQPGEAPFDPFEKSVFVMTKFPPSPIPPDDQLGRQLQDVIDAVLAGVKARGYVPRIASDHQYFDRLWQNVELFLLGCSKGVAIVESRYGSQVNPNVALEWGWMVGMGRRVLYLRDGEFESERADWAGLIHHKFEWAAPADGVDAGLQALLGD